MTLDTDTDDTDVKRRYKRKLSGWLSYAFASEVFVIVSLTLFLPICLEQFARDNGYLAVDRTVRCSSVGPTMGKEEGRCVVRMGWVWVDTASFSLYVYSISVALQALTVISMGGVADNPSHRKTLLLVFSALGSLSAVSFLFLPSESPVWWLSAVLAVLANVGFGASVVAMNAYLPSLARDSPEVRQFVKTIPFADAEDGEDDDGDGEENTSDEPLLPPHHQHHHHHHQQHQHQHPIYIPESHRPAYDLSLSLATSRISSLGIALGYTSGIMLLLLALVPVTRMGGSTWALRVAVGLSGVWWAVFSVPAGMLLPGGAGEESARRFAIVNQDDEEDAAWVRVDPTNPNQLSLGREISGAWTRLIHMLSPTEIKKLRNTFIYLAAWFLLSDGFTTITSTALLFGKTSLGMSPQQLMGIGIITPVSGILGSLVWPKCQRWGGWTNIGVIQILVVCASAVPLYGTLGFLPVFERWGVGGLRRGEEMFGLAVVFGMVYGAFQSYARAVYAELIPMGEEARWYGLFSITDKSSSFLGPLIVGLIADGTGNIRYAFFFLVGMIWAAVPVLRSVDVQRGRRDAREYRYEE